VRILAFCDYFTPEVGGGAERVAYEVYRRLTEGGAEVTIVTTTADTDGTSPDAGRWASPDGRLQVIRVPTMDLSRVSGLQLSLTSGGLRRARALVRTVRPHLLHANSLEFQTSMIAARLRRATGIPLILTAHIAGFASMPQPWRTLGAVHGETVGRFLLHRADRVIAVSQAVSRHVRSLGAPVGRIDVVPNGVDHAVFHPGPERLTDEVRVLLVGRLVPNKGGEEAIRAVAALYRKGAKLRLTIVGDGPLRGRLESLAVELGVDVSFEGWTDDVADRLRDTDVLLRPTLTEGMSLSVLEAMASGVCVVASAVPGNSELIRDGETGLLAAVGDSAALESALDHAVNDPEERHRFGAAALEASNAFSWDRCARETIEVFERVLRAYEAAVSSRGRVGA
jgi:glycosyltransferase involved in cell wall biosynthesis